MGCGRDFKSGKNIQRPSCVVEKHALRHGWPNFAPAPPSSRRIWPAAASVARRRFGKTCRRIRERESAVAASLCRRRSDAVGERHFRYERLSRCFDKFGEKRDKPLWRFYKREPSPRLAESKRGNRFSLSSGERAGVRASVKPNKIRPVFAQWLPMTGNGGVAGTFCDGGVPTTTAPVPATGRRPSTGLFRSSRG